MSKKKQRKLLISGLPINLELRPTHFAYFTPEGDPDGPMLHVTIDEVDAYKLMEGLETVLLPRVRAHDEDGLTSGERAKVDDLKNGANQAEVSAKRRDMAEKLASFTQISNPLEKRPNSFWDDWDKDVENLGLPTETP